MHACVFSLFHFRLVFSFSSWSSAFMETYFLAFDKISICFDNESVYVLWYNTTYKCTCYVCAYRVSSTAVCLHQNVSCWIQLCCFVCWILSTNDCRRRVWGYVQSFSLDTRKAKSKQIEKGRWYFFQWQIFILFYFFTTRQNKNGDWISTTHE